MLRTRNTGPSDGLSIAFDPWERKFIRVCLAYVATFFLIVLILMCMLGLIALRIAMTYDDQGEVDETKTMYGIAVTLLQATYQVWCYEMERELDSHAKR